MLRHLRANDERFKSVNFKEGLNLIVADTTGDSADTDTRNGAGKSSLVEVLHFLLGARFERRRSFLGKEALREFSFELEFDWSSLAEQNLHVYRSLSKPSEIYIDPDITTSLVNTEEPRKLSLAEWQYLLEEEFFALPENHNGVSGRAMLSLYMRRIGSSAFNEAIRTSPQQTLAEASTNLAYLLGLDWQLASRYRDLAARESTRRQLASAAKDPVWGRIVGRSSELRGQISDVQQRVNELARQIADFRVVPEYERLQARADEINQQIRLMRNEDIVDRRNLLDFDAAMEDVSDPQIDYLEEVYADLGVSLPGAVIRRYEEVREFHTSVVRNRRSYLEAEAAAIRERLAAREAERASLGEEQAGLLQTLNEGGALDALTALQQAFAREQALLESLRNRFEAARTLEASASEIRADRAQVESQMRADLVERDSIIDEISVRFREYAVRLYGPGRSAYLEIEPTSSALRVVPHIDSQDSRGIGNMVMFCFDLTVAVTAKRGGRGPDFLVHDSHLFDGVDERQVARALELAREVVDFEGMQYIATINSDDLAKAGAKGVELQDSVISPRLTDVYEDGGLFGFRFS
ncbi:ABC-three component system protein [Qaidamihabitans albus]|uniref:ABC-three component system protein n=1 Tax=Qaidamihabitans albus TaxID=2795733 RepID=UPI0018F1FAAF|nr:ABC-three component system protein [Qaidamihabitans albus]